MCWVLRRVCSVLGLFLTAALSCAPFRRPTDVHGLPAHVCTRARAHAHLQAGFENALRLFGIGGVQYVALSAGEGARACVHVSVCEYVWGGGSQVNLGGGACSALWLTIAQPVVPFL